MLQLLNFKDFWSEIGRAVMSFNSISDVLDVILVTFVIYSAIKLIRETKAVQLAKGFILLLIVYGRQGLPRQHHPALLHGQAVREIMSFEGAAAAAPFPFSPICTKGRFSPCGIGEKSS